MVFVYKLLLSHFIMNYDFKLASPSSPKSWQYYTFTLPNKSHRLLVRRRPGQPGCTVLEKAEESVRAQSSFGNEDTDANILTNALRGVV